MPWFERYTKPTFLNAPTISLATAFWLTLVYLPLVVWPQKPLEIYDWDRAVRSNKAAEAVHRKHRNVTRRVAQVDCYHLPQMTTTVQLIQYCRGGIQFIILVLTVAMIFLNVRIPKRKTRMLMNAIFIYSIVAQGLSIVQTFGSSSNPWMPALYWLWEWTFVIYQVPFLIQLLIVLADMEFFRGCVAIAPGWNQWHVQVLQVLVVLFHFATFGPNYGLLAVQRYEKQSIWQNVIDYLFSGSIMVTCRGKWESRPTRYGRRYSCTCS